MNDTTRRFLNAILARIPESSLVEVRLFPAIRQGGIESGVAVLAVEPDFAMPVEAALPEPEGENAPDAAPAAGAEVEVPIAHPVDVATRAAESIDVPAAGAGTPHPTPDASGDLVDEVLEELDRESALDLVAEGIRPVVGTLEPILHGPDEGEVDLVVSVEPGDLPPETDAESIALGDILALPSPEVVVGRHDRVVAHQRLAILCARYKLVLKGAERGRWDMDIVHQADAPLETLDRVIAGVIRRSGEAAEPERFTRERLRESLDAPAWAGNF